MFNSERKSLATFLYNHSATFVRGGWRRLISGLPYAFSFNIADRCPVGCQCYWRAQERVRELSDGDVIQFFEKKRDDGYVLANLVGGEPYVRPKLLRRVAGIVPLSWLMTSATTPLIRLERTTHMVSVDGANGETHDRVRRMKGLYERIIKHLGAVRAGGDFPTIIHTTLNAMNFQGIADLLQTWRDNGLADGVVVSTMTPIKGAGDDELRLSHDQRAWIVGELVRLKEIYGDFLCMTESQLRRLHPDHTKLLTPQVCGTAQWVESYDASGARMKQCILSEKADCRECGCVVTTMTDSTKPSTLGSVREAFSFSARLSTLR